MENGNTEVAQTTEAVESTATEAVKEPTFTELLQKPEYQKEFDKLVNKSLKTAKSNWEKDYEEKLAKEKSEAEKLAQMDAEQKMQYELERAKQEKEELEGKLNAINLYKTASDIAVEKDLPVGYLDLIDFSKENADSITEKIDKLQQLRARDLESYINNKLRQSAPTERVEQTNRIDPYLEGFKAEFE